MLITQMFGFMVIQMAKASEKETVQKIINALKSMIKSTNRSLVSLDILAARQLLTTEELENIMKSSEEFHRLKKIIIQKNNALKDQQMFDKKIESFHNTSDSYTPRVEIIQDLSENKVDSESVLYEAFNIAKKNGYLDEA